jgi:hypothetical protein
VRVPLLRASRTAVKPGVFLQIAVLATLPLGSRSVHAQERPFSLPRPWTAESGTVRAEVGLRGWSDREIPLSGLRGDLLEVQAGVIIGLASGIEARVEGVGWQRLAIESRDQTAPRADDVDADGSSTSDATDAILSTRVRLAGAGGPLTAAIQVGVRLPNAGNESGLGRDETDLSVSLLAGWQEHALRVAGEAGFAILGSPTHAAAQDDQGRLGLLIEIEPAGGRFAWGAEVRRSFGDASPGNELVTELAAGGRVRLASVWTDLAYRRLWVEGRGSGGIQFGLARTF